MASDRRMPRFGAHMSISGGLDRAVARAVDVGCETMQIFTRNNVQWRIPPLDDGKVAAFRRAVRRAGLRPVFAHNSYLINLASPETSLRRRSETAMVAELDRAGRLGLAFVVMHPGAHLGSGERRGLDRVARALRRILDATADGGARVALETTAGAGSHLGGRLAELEAIMQRLDGDRRVGLCLDSCHLFAAGYRIDTPDGYKTFAAEVVRRFGRRRLFAWHMNDSRGTAGSRLDRHAHIGDGRIGLDGFRRIVTDPRFAPMPMVLETPKQPEPDADRANLRRLRDLAGAGPS